MAWSDIRPGSERSHKMKAVRTTAIVIAGLSVTTVLLWQHAQVKLLSSENTVLHNQLSQIASLQETNSQLAESLKAALESREANQTELTRLRGQGSKLRQLEQENTQLKA